MARRRKLGPKRETTLLFDWNKMSHEIRMIVLEEGNGIIGELAKKVRDEAQRLAPVLPPSETPRPANKRSGTKHGPIKTEIFAQESDKVPASWLVCSPAWYSHFLEYGTKRHDVYPNAKKAMKFPGTKEFKGQTIIAKHVDHPATSPKPYLRPAADKAEQFLNEIVQSRH